MSFCFPGSQSLLSEVGGATESEELHSEPLEWGQRAGDLSECGGFEIQTDFDSEAFPPDGRMSASRESILFCSFPAADRFNLPTT